MTGPGGPADGDRRRQDAGDHLEPDAFPSGGLPLEPDAGEPESGAPPQDRGGAGASGPDEPGGSPSHAEGRGPSLRGPDELLIDSVGVAGEAPAGLATPGRRYLLDSERRVIFVRRHPALLLRYVFETLAALLVAGFLTRHLPSDTILLDLVWYGVLAVMGRLLYQVAQWSADRFVVTDRRMMLISGLITRRVAMMPLLKVTDMTYERPVIGRVLGYGEFVMESAGQDQALRRITYVPAPDRLYREVSELLFGNGVARPPAAAGGRPRRVEGSAAED